MTFKGIARGKIIELTESLPYEVGVEVNVSVEPVTTQAKPGAPSTVLHALSQPPHLEPMDVEAMDREIERGRLPVQSGEMFDPADNR